MVNLRKNDSGKWQCEEFKPVEIGHVYVTNKPGRIGHNYARFIATDVRPGGVGFVVTLDRDY